MKFTHFMMAFLLWFILASTTHAQTSIEGTTEASVNSATPTTALAARVFTVYTDQTNTKLNVDFEIRDAALTSIELVSETGTTTQVLDELIFDEGMHSREYYISHLEDGKYYCVMRSGNWVGAHSFIKENLNPVVGPVMF